MNMEEAAGDLAERIETAFRNAPWPARHQLVVHDPTDSPDSFKRLEETAIISHFGGKRRREFERDLTSGEIEELCSMSKLAVRYYLPSFLKRLLLDRGDFLFVIGMVSLLNMNCFINRWEYDFWPEFTLEESGVIVETIEFVLQHIKSYQFGELESQYRMRLIEAKREWRKLGLD